MRLMAVHSGKRQRNRRTWKFSSSRKSAAEPIDGRVTAIATSGNRVYFGGKFAHAAGQTRLFLAAADRSTGELLDWNSEASYSNTAVSDIRAMVAAPNGSAIYVTGLFSKIAGYSRADFASLDPQTGLPGSEWAGNAPSKRGYSLAIVRDGDPAKDVLYVGGEDGIASVDITSGTGLGWRVDTTSPVRSIAFAATASGNLIIASGSFQSVGGSGYDHCMKDRDRGEASNPPPRDVRDRRPSEPMIPPLDIVETCVVEAKQQVAAENARKAEARAAADERYRVAKEKLAACEKSPEAQIARSTNEIALYRLSIEIAKQHLERDKAIERTTGVIDVKGRRSDGEILVDTPPLIEEAFKAYRQAGGTARSAEDVKGMDDPCKALR